MYVNPIENPVNSNLGGKIYVTFFSTLFGGSKFMDLLFASLLQLFVNGALLTLFIISS